MAAFRSPPSRAKLALACVLLAGAARAGDKTPTPEGAERLQGLLAQLLGSAGGPPAASVKAVGADYVITADLGALTSLLGKDRQNSFEPPGLVLRAREQDDGLWRVEQNSFPKITTHSEDALARFEVQSYRQTFLIDPRIFWWRSGHASAEHGVLSLQGPDFVESFEFGKANANYATTVKDDQSLSTTVKEEIADVDLRFAAVAKDREPVTASGRIERIALNAGADGLRSAKIFALWKLVSAPRAALPEHQTELNDALRELAAPGLKFVEGAEASRAMMASPYGAVSVGGVKVALGVANLGAGSAIDAAISAEGLSLPVALAPPGAADLMPSKIDLAATFKGFDIAAAAKAAIDQMKVEEDGPAISDEGAQKVAAALLGSGPMRLEISPSHIVAPAIDAEIEGGFSYTLGKGSGAVTIRMRDFDKTMTAVRALRPEVQLKAIPALALAKGLAKTDADGRLSWIVEVDGDRYIKINGIPLGKTP